MSTVSITSTAPGFRVEIVRELPMKFDVDDFRQPIDEEIELDNINENGLVLQAPSVLRTDNGILFQADRPFFVSIDDTWQMVIIVDNKEIRVQDLAKDIDATLEADLNSGKYTLPAIVLDEGIYWTLPSIFNKGLITAVKLLKGILDDNKDAIRTGQPLTPQCSILLPFLMAKDICKTAKCTLSVCKHNSKGPQTHALKNCPFAGNLRGWLQRYVTLDFPTPGCKVCLSETPHWHCPINGRTDGKQCRHNNCKVKAGKPTIGSFICESKRDNQRKRPRSSKGRKTSS